MAKKGPEAQLLESALDALKHIGGVHAMRRGAGAMNVGGRWITIGEKGHPDIEVMLPKQRTMFIELKAPKAEETDFQKAWRLSAESMGHKVYLCRDVDSVVAVVEMERDEALKC